MFRSSTILSYRLIYAGIIFIIIGILLWLIPIIFPDFRFSWWSSSAVSTTPTPTVPVRVTQVLPTPTRQITMVRFSGNCEGNNPIIGVSVDASNYAPPSHDDGGNSTYYYPEHTLDCRADTSWRTEYTNGIQPWLRYTFHTPVVLTYLSLKPGYDKYDPFTGRPRWYQNWRVRSVHFYIEFVSGDTCDMYWNEITDSPVMQQFDMDSCVQSREVKRVTMYITDARPPQDVDPRVFVAISDMMFEGFQYVR